MIRQPARACYSQSCCLHPLSGSTLPNFSQTAADFLKIQHISLLGKKNMTLLVVIMMWLEEQHHYWY